MTKSQLFELAEIYFKIRQKSNHFIDKPEFYKFPLPVPDENISTTVVIHKGEIKEIEILYGDGSIQTIRRKEE